MSKPVRYLGVAVCALLLAGVAAQETPPGFHERRNALGFGEEFKAGSVPNLNPVAGPALIDLQRDLGERPVVLIYWIAGNQRSEDILLEFQAIGEELGRDKLAMFGVVVKRPGRGAELIRRRIDLRGITLPVIDDLARSGLFLSQYYVLPVCTPTRIAFMTAAGAPV